MHTLISCRSHFSSLCRWALTLLQSSWSPLGSPVPTAFSQCSIPSTPSPTATFSQPFSLQLSHTPQSFSEFLGTPSWCPAGQSQRRSGEAVTGCCGDEKKRPWGENTAGKRSQQLQARKEESNKQISHQPPVLTWLESHTKPQKHSSTRKSPQYCQASLLNSPEHNQNRSTAPLL